jgi:hypothetical protein
MVLSRLFRTRKSRRRYPVKRDEKGRSARSRCFEMFADDIPPPEIAMALGVKVDTVRRYRLQWQLDPDLEGRLKYGKSLFAQMNPHRDRNLELYATAWGITRDQLETILSQPHGWRRLVTGKIYAPAHAAADHKRYMALEMAVLIADHLTKHGGNFEDVFSAFQRWMGESMKGRKEDDAEVKDLNREMEFVHAVMAADLEQERAGRVQPDTLSAAERDAILRYGVASAKKKLEAAYWLRVARMMGDGLAPEQACEKIYQDFLAQGDAKGARVVREFQDKVHPRKNNDQEPPLQPPPPPSPT